ncbi:MAG: hypothetical protein WCC66_15480 [Rhizobiaceae bacterium]
MDTFGPDEVHAPNAKAIAQVNNSPELCRNLPINTGKNVAICPRKYTKDTCLPPQAHYMRVTCTGNILKWIKEMWQDGDDCVAIRFSALVST